MALAEAIAARYFLQGATHARAEKVHGPRVIYDVTHLTRYRYGAPVAVNACVLRLLPRSEEGQTRAAARTSRSTPRPQSLVERFDAFGNRVLTMRIETPHRELVVKATSRVAVDRGRAAAGRADAAVGDRRRGSRGERARSSRIRRRWRSFRAGSSPLFDAGDDLRASKLHAGPRRSTTRRASSTRRIKADFVYDSKATEVTTSPAEAFAQRRGVCQDFSHVMIAGLRGLGLPALYVSGYIRTIPAGRQAAARRGRRLARLGGVVVRPARRLGRPRSDQRHSRRRRSRRRRPRARLRRSLADGRRRPLLRRPGAGRRGRRAACRLRREAGKSRPSRPGLKPRRDSAIPLRL